MRIDPVPQGKEFRTERVDLWLTRAEWDWFTHLLEEVGEVVYRLTGEPSDLDAEDLAYMCVRAGMAAMVGLSNKAPAPATLLMVKREILPREEDEEES